MKELTNKEIGQHIADALHYKHSEGYDVSELGNVAEEILNKAEFQPDNSIEQIREWAKKHANESKNYQKIAKNRKRRWVESTINAMANEVINFIDNEVLK